MSKLKENLGVALCQNFAEVYAELNESIQFNGDVLSSRNGPVREFLNFKTIIENPSERCYGGYKRDANVFFLLAEALWIWAGRRDVAFLDIFNGNMKNYSDDGVSFHAAYGWRLRNWGLDSINVPTTNNNIYTMVGIDQVAGAIKMLTSGNLDDDRRIVMGIWNPELDLGTQSKDLPCNDIVMFKVRNGKLYSTIANRSNDLNWGLMTNVFQFSVLGEIIARIVGIELGDQVHNSQSLHVYTENELSKNFLLEYLEGESHLPFYNMQKIKAYPIDFNFETTDFSQRLRIVDFFISGIISRLLSYNKATYLEMIENEMSDEEINWRGSLERLSHWLRLVYDMLYIYIAYKKHKDRATAFLALTSIISKLDIKTSDIFVLGLNFFVSRFKKDDLEGHPAAVEALNEIKNLHPTLGTL